MKLRHTTPCAECPWRRESPAMWLGGHAPEMYADAVATIANACILPYKTRGGTEAKIKVGKRDDCFGHPKEFYEHHSDEEWSPPWLRRNKA